MGYILDSSALVDAYNKWYSPESIPSFWNKIEEAAIAGELFIPDGVLLELERIDDGLYRWCKDREEILVVPTTDDIQNRIELISNSYPNLRKAGVPGRNFADPIVIALAQHKEFSVVTHESYTGNINGPKIPDVCKDLGIRVMQIYIMVKNLGWQFS